MGREALTTGLIRASTHLDHPLPTARTSLILWLSPLNTSLSFAALCMGQFEYEVSHQRAIVPSDRAHLGFRTRVILRKYLVIITMRSSSTGVRGGGTKSIDPTKHPSKVDNGLISFFKRRVLANFLEHCGCSHNLKKVLHKMKMRLIITFQNV